MSQLFRRPTTIVFSFLLAACGSGSDPGSGPDGTLGDDVGPDGSPGHIDARPGSPDAHPGTPDAHPQPDAPPAGCAWHADLVSSNNWAIGSNVALAVSPTGERAIVFTGAQTGNRDLIVAKSSGGAFTVQAYNASLVQSGYESVDAAYGADGQLRIAYLTHIGGNASNDGVYSITAPGNGHLIDGAGLFGTVGAPRIAVGADGRSHIAYSVFTPPSDRRIAVATGSGANFSITAPMIDIHATGAADIALDANGRAVVSTIYEPSGGVRDLVYATESANGTWLGTSVITHDGGYLSGSNTTASTDGTIHIVRRAYDEVIHAVGTNGLWTTTHLTDVSLGMVPFQWNTTAVKANAAGQLELTWGNLDGTVYYERVGSPPVLAATIAGQLIRKSAIAFGAGGPYIAFTVGLDAFTSPSQLYLARCE